MKATGLMRALRDVSESTNGLAGKKGAATMKVTAGMKAADLKVIGASTRIKVSARYTE